MHALHEIAVDQNLSEDRRLQATESLAYFGSASVDLLVDSVRANPTLAASIIDSLVRVGPSGSAAMVSVLREEDLNLRRRALKQLEQWGGDSVSYLASQVDEQNAVYYYTLFDQIDPYWDRRRGSGAWFKQLVNAKRSYRWLKPAIDELFTNLSLRKSRENAVSIRAITTQMRWSSPAVAEELIRVESFMRSATYKKTRKAWVENDVRQHGRTGYVGTGAQYEEDGVGQSKDHLIGVARRNPESAHRCLPEAPGQREKASMREPPRSA